MFFQGILLLILGVLKFTEASEEDPVKLNYFCTHIKGKEEQDNKAPVVLIHEFGFSWQSWKGIQQVIALETGRRVCAVDLRNHGESPWSENGGASVMAKDIGYFLDQQNMTTANFIGHGIGGKVAVHYTLQNPSRVDSIVVEDMRPNNMVFSAQYIYRQLIPYLKRVIKMVPKGSSVEKARDYIAHNMRGRLVQVSSTEKLDDVTAKNLPIRCSQDGCEWKTNLDVLAKLFRNPDNFDIYSNGTFDGPALFIYGGSSYFEVHEAEANIKEHFPNAELFRVSFGGHYLHGVCPEFDDEIIKFLKKQSV